VTHQLDNGQAHPLADEYPDMVRYMAAKRRDERAAAEADERQISGVFLGKQTGREPGSDDGEIDAAYEAAVRAEARQAGAVTPAQARTYTWGGIHSAALAAAIDPPKWNINGIMVAGQPFLAAGSKKTLKTSVLIDVVLALGTGTLFLGHFRTYGPMNVAFLSGESGRWTIRETALRVCKAKGIELATASVWWDFRLPQLTNLLDVAELKRGLEENGIKVLVIDPLYLCLLANSDLDAKNLFDTGPLLLRIAEACLAIGCTPVLCHHFKKSVKEPYEPGELEDIAYGGFQEFARQWLLFNRREPYEPGTGEHRLWLSAGGSCGQGGVWGLDVSEGILADDFTGRRWAVAVSSAADARQEKTRHGDSKKQAAQDAKDSADELAVLNAIDVLMRPQTLAKGKGKGKAKVVAPDPPTANRIKVQAGVPGARVTRALTRLCERGQAEAVDVKVRKGRGAGFETSAAGFRRKHWGPPGD
jgi:hypothetical protein